MKTGRWPRSSPWEAKSYTWQYTSSIQSKEDLILPLNLLPRFKLASCVPQPCACLSCNPQTRKKQANSSLSRSSLARGRKESLCQTARKPNWSPATPLAASATAPSPPMKRQTVVWGKHAGLLPAVQIQGLLSLLLMKLNSTSAER